jgi:CelD/BcsL family acetyltransferase involved in cellulose biosynthesis
MERSDEPLNARPINFFTCHLEEWQELWLNNPSATLFNSPAWLEGCKNAFPNRNFFIVTVTADCFLGAVFLLEKKGNIWTVVGRPYMDRASILLDNDFMSRHGRQLMSTLLKKFQILDLSELSENQNQSLLRASDNLLAYSRISSLNPRFLISKPVISRKERREINRLTRRLSKQGDWSIELQPLNKNSFARMLLIEQSSHKVQDNQAILHKPGVKELFICVGSLKKSYVIFLIHNNKDIAHLLGLAERETFLAYHMAYCKVWNNCAPGKLLIYHSLQILKNQGFACLDFSRGESMIKEKFSDTSVTLYGLRLFNRSFVGYLYYFLYKVEQNLDLLRINLGSRLPVKYKKQLKTYFYFWLNRNK